MSSELEWRSISIMSHSKQKRTAGTSFVIDNGYAIGHQSNLGKESKDSMYFGSLGHKITGIIVNNKLVKECVV